MHRELRAASCPGLPAPSALGSSSRARHRRCWALLLLERVGGLSHRAGREQGERGGGKRGGIPRDTGDPS